MSTIKKATVSILLIIISLFSIFFTPIKAFGNTNINGQSYDDTPIEEDMANMEESEYPYNSFGEPSIVGFMENCFSNNEAYASYYGLYIYVYNPTEKPLIIREGSNQIMLSSSFGPDGKRASTKNYSLTYLDNTDNHRFYKFKLTDSLEQYFIAKEYASRWNDRRRYEITSLDLRFEGELNTKTFGISKIYEYSGFASWCGEQSLAISTLQCQYYGGQDVHLEVYDTNYRFAHKGDNLHDDLQSVYFSLPNEYSDQWGNLSLITAEWYEYKTSPMFVTKDAKAYSALFEMRNKQINEFGQLIDENGNVLSTDVQTYWRVFWDITSHLVYGDMGNTHTEYYIAKTYNGKCREDIDDDGLIDFDGSKDWQFGYWDESKSKAYDTYSSLNRLDWIFPIEKEINSIDDYRVSSKEVKEYIRKYAIAFSNQEKLVDKYPVNLFERYDGDGYQCNSFSVTDVYKYIDKNEEQTLWEQIWGINSTDSFNYSPIVTISEGDLYLSYAEFSEKYYVNKDDVEYIISSAEESYKNNETPYLLRFAITDYYASEARFDYAEEDKFDMSDVDGYVAQEHVFLNFDILSLEYTSEDGFTKTVVGVVADSIDIINGLTAPENILYEEAEWWQKLMAVLLLILLINIITNIFFPFMRPIFNLFYKLIGTLIIIVFRVFTIPLRLIFNRKRK